jgi:hypothetical protein
MAEPDIAIEYKTMPLSKLDLGSKFGSIAALAGRSKASNTPVKKEIVSNNRGVIMPSDTPIAVIKTRSAIIARVIINSLLRFHLSAITPPHIDKNNIGPKLQAVTRPSMYSSGLSKCINQRRPKTNDHIPMQEKTAAIQNILY